MMVLSEERQAARISAVRHCVTDSPQQQDVKRKSHIGIWKAVKGVALLICSLLLFPAGAFAQEFRGTISGTVTDPTGAAVPGASVEVQETQTGTVSRTASDSTGQYVVPFLLPGNYSITVKKTGFEAFTRSGITLQAQEHPIINLTLTIGSSTQTVTVTGEAPLLNQENASIGDVISTQSVADLPLNGRAPAMLQELSVGVMAESAPQISHPFDNNNMNSFSLGGTPLQTSEVLLDGSPDETLLGALAFSPSQDSVQEVSVQPFATDASFGHTIGGVVNQVSKSGTNALHGTVYEFSQVSALDANSYFNDRAGIPIAVTHFNQYGLTTGGPVWIPKVFNGKNKLFFFFAWEGLKDSSPATVLTSVPTPAEANGDFSALLAANASNQLYVPGTGTFTGGKTVGRTAVPNNCLGPAATAYSASDCPTNAGLTISPIAQAYLNLFKQPNTVTTAPDGIDNYTSNAPSVDDYSNEFGRLDYNLNDRNHFFFDFRHNYRSQIKQDYFLNNTNGSTLIRENWGTTLDDVVTIDPTTVFDVRLNWTYFYEAHDSPASVFSPTSVGLPAIPGSPYTELPVIKFASGSWQSFNNTAGPSFDPTTNYQVFADVAKLLGKHALKIGFDGRQYRMRIRILDNGGSPSGEYTFGSNWMTSGTSGSAQAFGGDIASFLLGLPTTGDDSYDNQAEGDYRSYYVAGFFQDDWKVSPRLTLNMGVRWDLDTPFGEKFGRTVSGFNPTAANSASGAVYNSADTVTVNNTTVLVNPSTFTALGGLTFPSSSWGAPYQIADNHGFLSPRFGFSYNPALLHDKFVVRGGFGMFVSPQTLVSLGASDNPSSTALSFQEGFSASTNYTSTNNSYFNNCTSGETTTAACPAGDTPLSLANPFPNGVNQPAGSTQGASTFLGESISFLAPKEHDQYSERWNLGVQYSITPSTLIEGLYVGNHALHLDVTEQNINAVQQQYMTTNPYPDFNLASAVGTKVANPFAGLLPLGASFNTSTQNLSGLLTPYPQFGSTAIDEYNETIGQSWFNSGMLHVEQRARHGLTLTANYAFSKLIEQDTRLNDEDNFLEKRISPFDHTHHFTAGGTYDLPFGRGKIFTLGGGKIADELAGGWVLNGIYQFQTGAPIYFSGDIPFIPGEGISNIHSQHRNTSPAEGANGTPALTNAYQVFATGGQSGFVGKTTTCAISACDGTVSTYNPNAGSPALVAASTNATFTDHYRFLPQTLSNVRMDGYNNLDASILKNIKITERANFQLRFETFNTLNHPIFAAPNLTPTASNFGYITATATNSQPRQVQIGGRIVF
ncbi:MAG: carboxypeptidase regulatory-like domain-containing protein [Terracidiphilus sp.]